MDYTKAAWTWGLDCLMAHGEEADNPGRWHSEDILWATCPNAEDVIRAAVQDGEWEWRDLELNLSVRIKHESVKRLIAAAPDLLRACREVLVALSKRPGTDDALAHILEDAIDLAEVRR